MKVHNIWLLAIAAIAVHVTFWDLSIFQAVWAFMTTVFCVLFWYLGEIRALMLAALEKDSE